MARNLDHIIAEKVAWALLLISVSAISSSVFACVTPFPAFAVVAAYVLRARAAAATAVAVWLANQAIGFGFLHYPWDQNTILWGLAIGVAAVFATLLASIVLWRMRHGLIVGTGAAFLVAFASYEAGLFLIALVLGGDDGFATAIVGQFALLNLAWTVGFIVLAETSRYLPVMRFVAGRNHRRAA
jgi:hypothetical protein